MRVYGIDFTSRPTRRKPITCVVARLQGLTLVAEDLLEWPDFSGFERHLLSAGPWISGIDFPFGLARRFIDNIGWPQSWPGYVRKVGAMPRQAFRETLDAYRTARPPGDKEHRRLTDTEHGAISPQKLYGTPVGLMFFEGAPRLLRSGVDLPGLHPGDPGRIVVEAYPGALARQLRGRRGYKQDTPAKQTAAQHGERQQLLAAMTGSPLREHHGIRLSAPDSLCDDPGGDRIDALLCAVQAAVAWTRRDRGFGRPAASDPLEGWIAMPADETRGD